MIDATKPLIAYSALNDQYKPHPVRLVTSNDGIIVADGIAVGGVTKMAAFYTDGKEIYGGPLRIKNAPVKHGRWMIVYKDSIDVIHPVKLFHSEDAARKWAGTGLVAIKKITIEEGEGL